MAHDNWVKWKLFCVDSFDELEGQYPLEKPIQNLGAHYESSFSMNRQEPISQWIHGIVHSWTFNTVLRAIDYTDDIRPKITYLQESVAKDDNLGRPPLYVWTWGSIEITCRIISIGGVQWDMAPAGILGELPREVSFSITLEKYAPFDLEVTDPNSPFAAGLTDTLYKDAKIGITYEAMALERYGEPLWGDLVRRRHPEIPYPLAGQVIALPEPENLLEENLEPEAAPLQRTAEGLAVRQELFELRGISKMSHVI